MRANLEERWPHDAEDNLERLANAGLPYDRKVMKCRNCGGKFTLITLSVQNSRLIHLQRWATVPAHASRSVLRLKDSRSSAVTAVPLVIVFETALRSVAVRTDAATVGKS